MSALTTPLSKKRKATDDNLSPDSHYALEDHIISDDQIIEYVKLTLQSLIEIQGEENLTDDHLPSERINYKE